MRPVRHGTMFASVLIAVLLAAPAAAHAGPVPTVTPAAAPAVTPAAAPAVTPAAAPAVTTAATTTSAAPITAATSVTTTTTTTTTTTSATASPTTAPSSTSPVRRPGPACTTNATATYPVICLPRGFGEDQPASLQAGQPTVFAAQIANKGLPAADATLTITLPAQLALAPGRDSVVRFDDPTSGPTKFSTLHCDRSGDPSTVTCDTGPIASGDNSLVLITLVAASSAKAGTSASFSVALSPVLPDVYPSTSVSATVDFLGTAHLHVTIDPSSVTVVVGHTARLVASLANSGPDKASDTFALAAAGPTPGSRANHFRITNGHPISINGGGGTSGSGGGSVTDGPSSAAESNAAQPVSSSSDTLAETPATRVQDAMIAAIPRISASIWSVGTIAPGHTAVVNIDVKAVSVGTGRLAFIASSESEDPSCYVLHPRAPHGCNAFALAHLRAVPEAPSSSSAALADTGPTSSAPLLAWALLALVAGAALSTVGRRQVRGRHRH